MRRCVWPRNLKNEEAMARIGPQRHSKKKKEECCRYLKWNVQSVKHSDWSALPNIIRVVK